jgi:hypothetical protein
MNGLLYLTRIKKGSTINEVTLPHSKGEEDLLNDNETSKLKDVKQFSMIRVIYL